MKYYLLTILVLLIFKSVAATTIATDTSENKLNYKQSKAYFLENYGKDDSTKALINYFFKKRKNAFYQTIIPVAAGGASALILSIALPQATFAGLILAIPLAAVIVEAPIYVIIGQVKLLMFSRKKLLTNLNNYNSGASIPIKFSRKKGFRDELTKLM